jgi:exopolysaccharide production protein ExoQ
MARSLRANDLFAAICFSIGPMAVLAPNGLAVILAAGGVGLALLEPVRLRFAHIARTPIYLLCLFAALALGSLAWTIDASEGIDGWIRICSSALLGLVCIDKALQLDASTRRRADAALIYGAFVGLCVLALQAASVQIFGWNGSLVTFFLRPDQPAWSFFSRSAACFACLLPFAVTAATKLFGRLPGFAFALAAAGVIFLFNSKAAELAIVAALLAATMFFISRRLTPRLLAASLAALVLLAPLLASHPALEMLSERRNVSVSIYHRAAIWQFVAHRVAEKPVLGWGLHAARNMPGAQETISRGAELIPLHPHNGPLQVWLELGAVGALIVAALLAWLGVNVASAAQAAALSAAFTVASISFGLWQGWWMAALWLLLSLAAKTPNDLKRKQAVT